MTQIYNLYEAVLSDMKLVIQGVELVTPTKIVLYLTDQKHINISLNGIQQCYEQFGLFYKKMGTYVSYEDILDMREAAIEKIYIDRFLRKTYFGDLFYEVQIKLCTNCGIYDIIMYNEHNGDYSHYFDIHLNFGENKVEKIQGKI